MEFHGPLAGVRVLDFTWGKAGPTATMILGDLGAEVIKIEGKNRPDGARGLPPRIDNKEALENSGYFNNTNRNKRGVIINMASPEGREVARKLIAESDVLIESFSAHVMDSWDLGYEELARINSKIIYVSMAGLGHTGPQVDYQTIGPTIQALSGLTHISGLPDKEPSGWGYSFMDNTAGYYGAIAVLVALYHRRRTGEGQWVDLAQVEAATTLTGTAILDFMVNNRQSSRHGNRSNHPAGAPHGVYRCAGEDRWCAISVFNDEEWQGLLRAMGAPGWAGDPKFASHLKRYENQDELERHLTEWTEKRDPYEVMRTLQECGVSAGVVQRGTDLQVDPQLQHLGFWRTAGHPILGECRFEGFPVQFSGFSTRVVRGAPLLGEMTGDVLADVLGMEQKEVMRLVELNGLQGARG